MIIGLSKRRIFMKNKAFWYEYFPGPYWPSPLSAFLNRDLLLRKSFLAFLINLAISQAINWVLGGLPFLTCRPPYRPDPLSAIRHRCVRFRAGYHYSTSPGLYAGYALYLILSSKQEVKAKKPPNPGKPVLGASLHMPF